MRVDTSKEGKNDKLSFMFYFIPIIKVEKGQKK